MGIVNELLSRNTLFAEQDFNASLRIAPSKKLIILGCVDPRVDPTDILRLDPGEAAIIRNVGGRVNPSLLETINILQTVAMAGGAELGEGWNFIVLQHTDCGITRCYRRSPHLLESYMGVSQDGLEAQAITDPYKAVAIDVETLRTSLSMPRGFAVTGLVYEVETGFIKTAVSSTILA